MKAVIMAGGEGTRLRPLTCNRPKPMVMLANKPIMEHIIALLKKFEIKDIAVTLQYLPDIIMEYFHDGSEFGVNLRYYVEKSPLGTAGSVKNAEDFLDETFVVMSGDALTDIDLNQAIEFHKKKGSMVTLVLKKVDVPLEYGVVVTNSEGKIVRFLEKPSWGEVFSDTVNTGIYILSPEIFRYFQKDEVFDFSKDLFPLLLKEGKPIYGFVSTDYWCDIGDSRALFQASIDILEGKVRAEIPGKQIKERVWVGEGTEIEENVVIYPPCIIGKNVIIKNNTIIGSHSVIGDYNIIGERSGIKRSVIWKDCVINNNVQIRGSTLCNKVHMKDNSLAFEHSIIGDDTIIKENAIIKPSIKIWPHKMIEAGAEVNTNLVWGAKYLRSIFGNRGISGTINVDITPEFASKLGAAYGAIFDKKACVAISCDDSNAAHMLKISFSSGLLSSGVEIYDFGKMLLPITRSAIRFYRTNGGIHISTSTEDSTKLYIDFLDQNGSNINRAVERKIENAFTREDFRRCEGNCIKKTHFIEDYSSFYVRSILNSLKSPMIEFRIALNTRSPFICDTFDSLLTQLGCYIEVNNLDLSSIASKDRNDVLNFSHHVQNDHFDIGVSIEDTSEKMMLIDDKGRIITEDMFIALISLILFKTIQGSTIVVPISASQVIEKIAQTHHGKVIRTKTAPQEIMGKMLGNEVKAEMLEQFTMHYDAIAGLVKILDFMSVNKIKLSELIDMIPDIHIHKKDVACPWDAKGRVIRKLIQDTKGDNVETLEGVKVFQQESWVLVLPDSEQPTCRVISESSSAEFAEELSNIYVNKIEEISRG